MESVAEDRPSGEMNANALIRGLIGSQDAITSLAQVLIPSLLMGLKSGEQSGWRVTSSLNMRSHEKNMYNSTLGQGNHFTADSAAGSQKRNVSVSETSNAAGSETRYTAGHSLATIHCSNAAGTHLLSIAMQLVPVVVVWDTTPLTQAHLGHHLWPYIRAPTFPIFLWVHQPSNIKNPGPP